MDTTIKILEEIHRKLNGSAVLNGGFDKLVTNVELIKQKQNENADEMKKLKEAMYDPHEGLISKIKDIEKDIENHNEALDEIKAATKQAEKKVEKEVETELTQKFVTNRLKRVAGEDLEKLESTIQVAEKVKTLHWQLILAICALVAKTVFDIIKHH